MKTLILLSLLISGSTFAMPVSSGNGIVDSNIICTSTEKNSQFLINTKAGKVWHKSLSDNATTEVLGPLFSGVYSSEKYSGEILGEINYLNVPSYATLIMRDEKGKPVLEAQLYSKASQDSVTKYSLNCEIK